MPHGFKEKNVTPAEAKAKYEAEWPALHAAKEAADTLKDAKKCRQALSALSQRCAARFELNKPEPDECNAGLGVTFDKETEMKVGDKLIVDGEEATVMEAKIFWATRCTNAEMELAEIREQLAAAQAMNVDLQTNLSALQELAIWMTGCGYDFARLEFFQHEKYLLSLPPVNLNSTSAVDRG